MTLYCRIRAFHNWLIHGGRFEWILGHTCYEQEDGSFACAQGDWHVSREELLAMGDIDDE